MRASGYWTSKLHPRTYFKAGWRISATGPRAWIAWPNTSWLPGMAQTYIKATTLREICARLA